MGLLNQLEKCAIFTPTVQVGVKMAAPPGFVFKAKSSVRMSVEQFHQLVASFFTQVIRIRAGNPMFGTHPVNPEALQRGSHRLDAHQALHQLVFVAGLASQGQLRKQAGFLPKFPRALVQDLFQFFSTLIRKFGCGFVRTPRTRLQNLQPLLIELLDYPCVPFHRHSQAVARSFALFLFVSLTTRSGCVSPQSHPMSEDRS